MALADAGYAVDHAPDGEEAQFLGETEPYDAVILDLGLPKVDGVSVLERWRRENMATPVLILTARGAWSEKVAGFDAGADDYLTKPFHTEELLARLRALLRRSAGHAAPSLSCGGLRLDPPRRPRQRQRRAPAAYLARIPAAALSDDAPGPGDQPHRAGRAPSTTRTSIAIPIPSRCSSAGCARRSAPSASRPSAASATA